MYTLLFWTEYTFPETYETISYIFPPTKSKNNYYEICETYIKLIILMIVIKLIILEKSNIFARKQMGMVRFI